jgi:hypothetical protein
LLWGHIVGEVVESELVVVLAAAVVSLVLVLAVAVVVELAVVGADDDASEVDGELDASVEVVSVVLVAAELVAELLVSSVRSGSTGISSV